MKRFFKDKRIITLIAIVIVLIVALFMTTGCNQNMLDFNMTFDYAECYLNGEYTKYEIKKWSDYDGEQIQIVTKDGKTYLVSMNYCKLVKE